MKLVYSDGYFLDFGEAHVFPVEKYRLLRASLDALVDPSDFVEPEPATDEDILRVHTGEYLARLRSAGWSEAEARTAEVPMSDGLVRAFRLATGGTILAGRRALDDGRAMNLSGGFHHAFPDHAEGFCLLNDVAIAVRALQAQGRIARAMIVDCDVHHGNGTAHIFGSDPGVFTISLHQASNYPAVKPPGDIDVHLPDGCGDEEYLRHLEQSLEAGFASFNPDIAFYLAGADPYREDLLGGLNLTLNGLAARDRIVIDGVAGRGVPCAIVLAGGYARRREDTVAIHHNTVRIALGREPLAGTRADGPASGKERHVH